MPKKGRNATILARWVALDWYLSWRGGGGGKDFARRWKVTRRTVRRDLETFREMGQEIDPSWGPDKDRTYRYVFGTKPLFVQNIKPNRPDSLPRPPARRAGPCPARPRG